MTIKAAATTSKEVTKRIAIERKIAAKCVKAFLSAGYLLGVNDGEETTVKRSRSFKQIMAALGTTDEDYLLVYSANEPGLPRLGYVYFVYGNSGYDLISDYSAQDALFDLFGEILKPVDAYAETFDV